MIRSVLCFSAGIGAAFSSVALAADRSPAAALELLVGTADGKNPLFTLSRVPDSAYALRCFRNGILTRAGEDYDLNGQVVTFRPTSIPQAGDIIKGAYIPAASRGRSATIPADASAFAQTSIEAKNTFDAVALTIAATRITDLPSPSDTTNDRFGPAPVTKELATSQNDAPRQFGSAVVQVLRRRGIFEDEPSAEGLIKEAPHTAQRRKQATPSVSNSVSPEGRAEDIAALLEPRGHQVPFPETPANTPQTLGLIRSQGKVMANRAKASLRDSYGSSKRLQLGTDKPPRKLSPKEIAECLDNPRTCPN